MGWRGNLARAGANMGLALGLQLEVRVLLLCVGSCLFARRVWAEL